MKVNDNSMRLGTPLNNVPLGGCFRGPDSVLCIKHDGSRGISLTNGKYMFYSEPSTMVRYYPEATVITGDYQ